MCAIAGFLGYADGLMNLTSMLGSMDHRGPDNRGTFEEGTTLLGHNRLSILDLSDSGNQPMISHNENFVIVFNGEIYNYQELKEILPLGFKLKSNTDTEVILELWSLIGSELLPKLRGMFAIAIWDRSNQKLVLARDHMGIKPLYYSTKDDKLLFASEIKGILASGLIEKDIDESSVCQYLTNGYILQPNTILRGVKMLPPASLLIWQSGEFHIQSFWNLTEQSVNPPLTEEDSIKAVYQLVNQAVKEEIVADRQTGVFLSGGLDSAVLLAALKNNGFEPSKTFSIGFDEGDLSEHIQAEKVAAFYNTEHFQIQVSEKDVVPYINQYILALDQPSVDGLNTWLVSKFASKVMTVGLSGLGGDEVFSGYGIDRLILHRRKYNWVFKIIYRSKRLFKFLPRSYKNKLEIYSTWRNLPSFYKTWGQLYKIDDVKKLVKGNIDNENQFVDLHLPLKFSLLKRLSYMHHRGFMMSRLLRDSDAVSMSHSMEIRFPLIDFRLVNLVFNLSDDWKVKKVSETVRLRNYEKENGYEANGVKHLLYQAFKKDLPPGFGLMPKRGFKMPIEKWMMEGLKNDISNVLNNENSFLDSQTLKLFYFDWEMGKLEWTKVWSLYILEKWVSENLK